MTRVSDEHACVECGHRRADHVGDPYALDKRCTHAGCVSCWGFRRFTEAELEEIAEYVMQRMARRMR